MCSESNLILFDKVATLNPENIHRPSKKKLPRLFFTFLKLISSSRIPNSESNMFIEAIKHGMCHIYLWKIFCSLEYFSHLGDEDEITSLIGKGINMSLKFDSGQTPIHVAAESGNEYLEIIYFQLSFN